MPLSKTAAVLTLQQAYLFLCFSGNRFADRIFDAFIPKIEAYIRRHHDDVRDIKPKGEVVFVLEELCAYAADIAECDKAHKQKAFALCRLRSQRAGDRHRPRKTEAQNHNRFENARGVKYAAF